MPPAGLPDDELIRRIKQQDREAFADLYQRHHRPLMAYIGRLVGDPAVAEELFQELFLAVWQTAGRFRGHSSVRTWLYRIAYNQAVSWLRKKRPLLWDEPPPALAASAEPLPELRASQAIQREQIQSALEYLTPDHRAVVELTFYHQMSYREIAEIMNCPVGTVKSRMSYARRQMAAVLLRMGVEEPGHEY